MGNFDLDFDSLKEVVAPDTSRIPLKGNEHRIIRVAFDMVRFKDGGPEELWQIQSSDDGEFLVRTFDLPDEENIVVSNWKVALDKKEENLTIACKNIPIKRIACSEYGINNTKEAWALRDVICEKLNNNAKFAKNLVLSLPVEKQNIVKSAIGWEDVEDEQLDEDTDYFDEVVEDKCQEKATSIPIPADDQWKLAFLELQLSKKATCEGCEQMDEELLEKAYYALEHYVESGSEDAINLAALIYDTESGSGDFGMLRRMIEELEEKDESISGEEESISGEEEQLVEDEIPLSFREFMSEEELGPEEELSFEEEDDKPDMEKVDEILDEMRDIKGKIKKAPEFKEKSWLEEKLNQLKAELAEIATRQFGAKKPTHLYNRKGFSESEFLPTAEEYFEGIEEE